MIVLDASVLIAHLDRDDALHVRAEAALNDAAAHPFASSTITLAEVFVGPARRDELAAAEAAVGELGVAEIGLGADAPARLARLRAESDLKLPDCCVLLAAQDAGAAGVLSFDDRLSAAAVRHRTGAPPSSSRGIRARE